LDWFNWFHWFDSFDSLTHRTNPTNKTDLTVKQSRVGTAHRRQTEGRAMNESQEIKVGQMAQISREITSADLSLFAAATGDFNPVHFDPVYAAGTFFKERIAHGMIAAGLISGVIGMKLPGPGTVYVQQTLNFLAPVRINDVVTVKVEVVELLEKNRVRLKTTVVKQDGVTAVDGEALVTAPKKR